MFYLLTTIKIIYRECNNTILFAIFEVIANLTEFIIVHFGILAQDSSDENFSKACVWIIFISLAILIICIKPIIMLILQTFSMAHPKWSLNDKMAPLCLMLLVLLGIFFVGYSIAFKHIETHPDIILSIYESFILKHWKNEAYFILYALIFIVLALMPLLDNKLVNKLYIKKYGKIKFFLNRLKIQRNEDNTGEDTKGY